MGGFDKIENCQPIHSAKLKQEFVTRYSAACFDPDDLSLITEVSSNQDSE